MVHYLKNLFHSFLVIFFANYLIPGVGVMEETKIPYVRSDLLFPFALGLLNTAIVPALKVLKRPLSALALAAPAAVLNLIAYAIVKLLPVEIRVQTVEGYLFVCVVVAMGTFLINFLEIKRHPQPPKVDSFPLN